MSGLRGDVLGDVLVWAKVLHVATVAIWIGAPPGKDVDPEGGDDQRDEEMRQHGVDRRPTSATAEPVEASTTSAIAGFPTFSGPFACRMQAGRRGRPSGSRRWRWQVMAGRSRRSTWPGRRPRR